MHCPRCGAANVDGAVACAACGSPLAPMPYAPTAPSTMAPPMARPTGVTVLAVIDFVFAGLAGLAALGFLLVMASGAASDPAFAEEMGVIAGLMGVAAVVVLLFGALYGALGWGLLKGKEWARIVHLVLAGIGIAGIGLGLLSSLGMMGMDAAAAGFSLVWNLVWGALMGFILWYLLQPGVRAWFART